MTRQEFEEKKEEVLARMAQLDWENMSPEEYSNMLLQTRLLDLVETSIIQKENQEKPGAYDHE